ncbi:Fic family protein [bacterium]|nr:Fic family protein [bacterium]
MKIFILEKPKKIDINPESLINIIFAESGKYSDYFQKVQTPVYYYWDRIKYKNPSDISPEEFWEAIKLLRRTRRIKSVIKNKEDGFFYWSKLPQYESFFNEIDLHTGGQLFSFPRDIEDVEKHQFLSRGIMEEAIASSQLEGAVTTRQKAKGFLREGRKPINHSEHMILNNYLSMKAIQEEYKNKAMDINLLFELHKMITRNTLEENGQGAFRSDSDDIVVGNNDIIYFVPPRMEFVEKEIHKLIEFANDKVETIFIHPVVKAIMLHFWIGYLHPFKDGNGRLARLLFYWYLLKKDYWAFAYLPISKIIKKSQAQYRDAYIYSEQDDSDLTYFIDFNIRKIQAAVKDFKKYIQRKTLENKGMSKLAQQTYNLNLRQINLLQYFNGNKEERTHPKLHKNVHGVSKLTAIKDLKELQTKGFLTSKKQGRGMYYYPTSKILELFD